MDALHELDLQLLPFHRVIELSISQRLAPTETVGGTTGVSRPHRTHASGGSRIIRLGHDPGKVDGGDIARNDQEGGSDSVRSRQIRAR
jgi:hypothetical protein